jgi:hypothetical protein
VCVSEPPRRLRPARPRSLAQRRCRHLRRATYARSVSKDHERRLHLLVGYRYFPDHLHGLVALLLFFVALVLGAAVATLLHSLF